IGGDAADSYSSRNVVVKRIEILGVSTAAIEIEAKTVGEFTDAAVVSNRHVETANRRAATNARERIREVRIRAVIVKAKGQIVARSATSSTTPPSGGCGTQRVVDTDVQVVAATVRGCHEMEILETPWKIRLRDVLQQRVGNWIYLWERVVYERNAGRGIDY